VNGEFLISELTDDDVPAVVTLCQAALDLPEDAAEAAEIVLRLRERSDAGAWTRTPRQLAGFVATAPDPDERGSARLVDGTAVAGRTVGVVLGSISQWDPTTGHVDLVAVHPAHRRHGIGRSLLTRIEQVLADLGATEVMIAGNAPFYAWPGVDVRYTPALCTALALGYEQDQTAWNMTADLSSDSSAAVRSTAAAEKRLADAGITVRRAGPADVPALVDFALENFVAGWAGEISDSIGRDRAGCHIAVGDSGQIEGFASYGSSRPSWFGPMGIATTAQGLGIGGVLLRRCLADQRADGNNRVQIGWVGPVPFYSGAADARIERVFVLYRKQL
jgi:mycothiol synthase